MMNSDNPSIILVKTWLILTTKNYPFDVRKRANQNIKCSSYNYREFVLDSVRFPYKPNQKKQSKLKA